MAEIASNFNSVLILDFGSQYSHLIARRIREIGVYCELLPCTAKLEEITFTPKGIILSGGPSSVYDKDAPHADPSIWSAKIPILGICYGLQEMVHASGGKVAKGEQREYGHAKIECINSSNNLFANVTDTKVWMSHGDKAVQLPPGFHSLASTGNSAYAAIGNDEKLWFGLQFHPEVSHTPNGKQILKNFINICQCEPNWKMESFIEKELERIRALIPMDSHVIGAVSGGVDSTVAAKLMSLAIGDRFHAIFVDNGLCRQGEVEEVDRVLGKELKIKLKIAYSSNEFLTLLKGVEDPEQKRKIIGNTFVKVFEREAAELKGLKVDYLLQGTLYPDVIESISFKGPSATIKTHHNVGGLTANMKLKVVEPLRELFKDEVRELGKLLSIPQYLLGRHPFPGPGLAIRILGEVNELQLSILRKADAIFIEEIRSFGIYDNIAQAFCVLLPVRSVGVMGDSRTYEQVICLRSVESSDFMTADWSALPDALVRKTSTRIINEVPGINRVVYDVSSKPPATIEWE